MSSSNLVPCHECGALISPTSSRCVKCRSDGPHAICPLCQKPVKPSLGVRGPSCSYVHPECIRQLLPIYDFACRDCGASLKSQLSSTDPVVLRTDRAFYEKLKRSVCRECGKPTAWGGWPCEACGLYMIAGDYYDGQGPCLHRFCQQKVKSKSPLGQASSRPSSRGCLVLLLAGLAGSLALIVAIITVGLG